MNLLDMRFSNLPYFNSIKVQLELLMIDWSFIRMLFQFHKGTIRTCQFSNISLDMSYFNSIKVQLELQNSYLIIISIYISIP